MEALLGGLAERRLDFFQPRLYLLDGSKAIRRAISTYAGEAPFPTLSGAQDPQCHRTSAGCAAARRQVQDASGLHMPALIGWLIRQFSGSRRAISMPPFLVSRHLGMSGR